MEIPIFNATIYYIDPKFIAKLEEKFKKYNYYRKLIILPNKGYNNPEYRKKVAVLQQRL